MRTGVDAEKHPAGFKQLQFSLRDSLRRLDAVIVNMTGDEQAPFLDIRKELEETNSHLIEHLFPHDPHAKQDHPATRPWRTEGAFGRSAKNPVLGDQAMRNRIALFIIVMSVLAAVGHGWPEVLRARAQKISAVKDYLTEEEADKIRDARVPAERIKLYVSVRRRPPEEIRLRSSPATSRSGDAAKF